MSTIISEPQSTRSSEELRLIQRENTKNGIGKCQVVRIELAEVVADVAASEQRADEATEAHQRRCEPLQARLDEISSQMASLLGRREEIPAKLTGERKTILTNIAEANRELELIVTAEQKLRQPLLKRQRELGEALAHETVYTNELAGKFAKPEWQLQSFTFQEAIKWAVARQQAAEKQVAKWREAIVHSRRSRDFGAEYAAIYSERLPRWEAEYEAATQALADLQREQGELRQKMIDE